MKYFVYDRKYLLVFLHGILKKVQKMLAYADSLKYRNVCRQPPTKLSA